MGSASRCFAVYLLLLAGCSPSPIDHRRTRRAITGGEAVAEGELEAVGVITTNAVTVCTGTLIAADVVLTAAHCVEPTGLSGKEPVPPDDIEYFFSFERAIDPNSPGGRAVERVVWHEAYPDSLDDIALLFLAEPASDRPVQRLAGPERVEGIEIGESLAIAGYGLTEASDDESVGDLTRGTSRLDERAADILVTGTESGQQACYGDSGGPLFAGRDAAYQIGIASTLRPSALPGSCSEGVVYTRIDAYAPWLLEHVPELDLPVPEGGGGCRAARGRPGGWIAALVVALILVARRSPLSSGGRQPDAPSQSSTEGRGIANPYTGT